MTAEKFRDLLKEAESLHRGGKYDACVRECGIAFESAFRDLFAKLINDLEDANVRNTLLEHERRIAKGSESYKRFGLGKLVALFTDSDPRVLDQVKIHLKLNFTKIRRISWKDVVALRNIATHDEANSNVEEEDALQMCYWLKIFLCETRLIEGQIIGGVPKTSCCNECHTPLLQEWRFCPACGTCVHSVCLNCQALLEPNFKICPYCETPIRGASPANARAIHQYEMLFRGAYLDMVLTVKEQEMLEAKRLELGLTSEQTEEIRQRCIPKNIREYQQLVEAVYADGIVNEAERSLLDKKAKLFRIDADIAKAIEEEVRRSEVSS